MCKRYYKKEICKTCKNYIQHYNVTKFRIFSVNNFHCMKEFELRGKKEADCPLYEKGKNNSLRNKYVDATNIMLELKYHMERLEKGFKDLKEE